MSAASNGFDWNDTTIGRLKELWAEGHSTAEIGHRMRISKNAVIGKSHRLNLEPRPSPIRTEGAAKGRPVRRPRCPSLTELQTPRLQALLRPVVRPPSPDPHAEADMQAAPPATPRRDPVLGKQSCCWPIGEPGTLAFRFCGATNEAGTPYCPEHCDIAYPKRAAKRTAA